MSPKRVAEKLIENFQCSFSPPLLNHNQPLYCSLKLKRPEKNPLDLNNLPDDYTRDASRQLVFEEGFSSSGYRTKKSGAKDGKGDECGKIYECRFCSLKFCKSQALGGHMNRHRQERETETLNRARQLVFSNDNLTTQGYHPGGNVGDPTVLPFRSVGPPRLFSGSSSTLLPPQPYLHSSPSQYPNHAMNDYYVGHVLGSSSLSHSQYHQQNLNYQLGASDSSNYTCIGAPVGNGFGHGLTRGGDLVGSGRVGGGFRDMTHQHFDHPSTNRYQDGF